MTDKVANEQSADLRLKTEKNVLQIGKKDWIIPPVWMLEVLNRFSGRTVSLLARDCGEQSLDRGQEIQKRWVVLFEVESGALLEQQRIVLGQCRDRLAFGRQFGFK